MSLSKPTGYSIQDIVPSLNQWKTTATSLKNMADRSYRSISKYLKKRKNVLTEDEKEELYNKICKYFLIMHFSLSM